MAKKVIKVGDCKFILLKWRDKWVFPLISYYLSGKDSPIYFALFSWNLKEGKFVKEPLLLLISLRSRVAFVASSLTPKIMVPLLLNGLSKMALVWRRIVL